MTCRDVHSIVIMKQDSSWTEQGGDLCIFLPKVGDFGNTFSVFFNSATQVFRCIVRLYVTCEDSGFLVTARAAEFWCSGVFLFETVEDYTTVSCSNQVFFLCRKCSKTHLRASFVAIRCSALCMRF